MRAELPESTPPELGPEGGVAEIRITPSGEGGITITPYRQNPLIVYNISCGHERYISDNSANVDLDGSL